MSAIKILIPVFIILAIMSCNSSSKKQDGSKIQKEYFPETYIDMLDSTLIENSGLIYWGKLLWIFNDSGGKNELYGLNPKTEKIIITLQIENAINIDWEDIAQDENFIYIADIGNNLGDRCDLQILKLRKSEITKQEFQTITAEKIRYNYAGQTNFHPRYKQHCFDCEALFAFNDTLYIFTKDWVSYITKAFAVPAIPGNYALNPIDSFNVNGLVTGADINANGNIALVGYQDFKSFVWLFQKSDSTLFSNPKWIDLSMLENAQTEGICFTPRGDLLLSCEQTVSYQQQIWKINTGRP